MEEKTILPCRRPFQSREKVEVLEWITNRGKDSVWVLRLLSTCSMNAQNLPRFSKIHRSNGKSGWIWHMGTEGISHLRDEFLKFIPFFWNSLKKKMENRVKDWIWHPRINSTWRKNSQNLPRFSRIHSEHKLLLKLVIFSIFHF